MWSDHWRFTGALWALYCLSLMKILCLRALFVFRAVELIIFCLDEDVRLWIALCFFCVFRCGWFAFVVCVCTSQLLFFFTLRVYFSYTCQVHVRAYYVKLSFIYVAHHKSQIYLLNLYNLYNIWNLMSLAFFYGKASSSVGTVIKRELLDLYRTFHLLLLCALHWL